MLSLQRDTDPRDRAWARRDAFLKGIRGVIGVERFVCTLKKKKKLAELKRISRKEKKMYKLNQSENPCTKKISIYIRHLGW